MKRSTFLAAALSAATLHAAPIPLNLARPDGKPGSSDKPVKVYILAGQSNMVGMGDIKGAQPPYPAVYLAADPAIIKGKMPAGTSRSKGACKWFWKGIPAVSSHGVYQAATGDVTGATVAIYKGSKETKATTMNLGQVAESVPTMEGASKTVAKTFIDVPETGNYLVHVGYGDSTHAIAELDGKEVYRKEAEGQPALTKVTLEAGKRYPAEDHLLQGRFGSVLDGEDGPARQGRPRSPCTKKDGKFPWLVDDEGNWTVRNDVYFQEARILKGEKAGPLTATSNGNSHRPGTRLRPRHGHLPRRAGPADQDRHGQPLAGLRFPPAVQRPDRSRQRVGVAGIQADGRRASARRWTRSTRSCPATRARATRSPASSGGRATRTAAPEPSEEYEKNLVNLINDVRKEFKAPKMPVVVATVGFGGHNIERQVPEGSWKRRWRSAIRSSIRSSPAPWPRSTPATSGARSTSRRRSQDYHYNRNAEIYMLTGDALGRAMVGLLGGEAAEMPKSDREAKTMAAMKAEAATPQPTAEAIAASNAAVKPMILDGLLQAYLSEPRNRGNLEGALVTSQPRPAKTPEYLEDAVDDVVAFKQEAGIDTYDWKPVLPDMHKANWDTFGFDLANNPYDQTEPVKLEKGQKFKPTPVELKLPTGQENWFAADFDAKKAGWKNAPAPFGKTVEKEWPENIAWIVKYPPYPAERPQPATVVENDVLLMRGTFDLPPAKEGHRYRIRVDGNINANSGEGFAIHVNGKLLGEQKDGVTAWRKQGLRGSHVWQEFRDDFKGGPVTIAVANFPMSNWQPGDSIPAIGPLSVWIEEQKLPQPELPPLED